MTTITSNNTLTLNYSNFKLLKKSITLNSNQTYLISSDKNADIRLAKNDTSSISLYHENGKWLAMAISGKFTLQGVLVSSGEIKAGDQIEVANLILHANSNETKTQSSDNRKKSRIKILILFAVSLVIVVIMNTKNPTRTFVENAANNTLHDDQVTSAVNTLVKVKLNEDQTARVDQFYRAAAAYYDLRQLNLAIKELQKGLLVDANNELLQEKLIDWEMKLDDDLTRYYRQACLHAKYLRNYEARQSFAMVVELSLNQSDLRYKDAKVLLNLLDKKPKEYVRCGQANE